MRNLSIVATLLLVLSCDQKNTTSTSKNSLGTKEITLEDIWGNTFSIQRMNALNSMKGDFYTLLNRDENGISRVDKYQYKTLEKVTTVVDGKQIGRLGKFESYVFNNDETKLILGIDLQKVYRRSKKGTYYAYDIASKRVSLIGKNIQEPTFSPDNSKIAYAQNNNLFILNLQTNKITQVTQDGRVNSIINGTTDWVYEEEFGFVRAYEWSNNGQYIAFLRFDESRVREFSMNVTGNDLYPTQHVFKYPKAGEDNAKVSLHMYDLNSKKTAKMTLDMYEYIPRIEWSSHVNTLIVTTLNRRQNDLKLFKINASNSNTTLLLNEKDEAYVDIHDNLTFLNDHSFIWTSEKDGFNHVYHYDFNGKLINQITRGNWEVTNYYGFHPNNNKIYYQSVENGSINRGVYSIDLDGKNKKLLSNLTGNNHASFSDNLNYFINTHSTTEEPPTYSLYSSEGEMLKVIKDNASLKEKLATYKISPKEFSTIKINGEELNMWMIKPTDFNPNKAYPLLMFQYSGPGSQQVINRWNGANDYWHQMLAQQGMIIACVDPRGTGLKGRDFKKVTQNELGKYEVEDQIAAARELGNRSYIDKDHIGIWGWSYGGFMSTNCLLKGNDVFSAAIAVAPVTSWRFYDTVYTERYMQTPQENASGYDENSPINYADQLEGKYLLVHGSGDDNVHQQNTMRMVNALVAADKPFDLFIYPDRAHGIYRGKNTRLHLYKKMTSFIQESLNRDK